jgi:hypothetical protein
MALAALLMEMSKREGGEESVNRNVSSATRKEEADEEREREGRNPNALLQIRILTHNSRRLPSQLQNNRLEVLPTKRTHDRTDTSGTGEVYFANGRVRDEGFGYGGGVGGGEVDYGEDCGLWREGRKGSVRD